MSFNLDGLREEVREIASATDAAITLVESLAGKLRYAIENWGNDDGDLQSQVNALADELDAASNRLGLAITANTVAEDDSDNVDTSELDSDDNTTTAYEPGFESEGESVRSGEGVTGADSAVDTNPAGEESEIAQATEAGDTDGNLETDNTVGSENMDEEGNAAA